MPVVLRGNDWARTQETWALGMANYYYYPWQDTKLHTETTTDQSEHHAMQEQGVKPFIYLTRGIQC